PRLAHRRGSLQRRHDPRAPLLFRQFPWLQAPPEGLQVELTVEVDEHAHGALRGRAQRSMQLGRRGWNGVVRQTGRRDGEHQQAGRLEVRDGPPSRPRERAGLYWSRLPMAAWLKAAFIPFGRSIAMPPAKLRRTDTGAPSVVLFRMAWRSAWPAAPVR